MTQSPLRSTLAVCVLAFSLGTAINLAVNAAEVSYVLHIENGHAPENMRLIRVKQNDVVRLEWSADKPMTVHLHGYDIEKKVAAGAGTEKPGTARPTRGLSRPAHPPPPT